MIQNTDKMFARLNELLEEAGEYLQAICVGGYVLMRHDIRATMDVDAFFKSTDKINRIIYQVGEEFGANTDELWLNNSVQNLNDAPPKEICEKTHDFSNLTVLVPPLTYIAGMKLATMREGDVEDAALIIKKEGIATPEDLNKDLKELKFSRPIDESCSYEAFGLAYGMEWLEKYYVEKMEKDLEPGKLAKDEIRSWDYDHGDDMAY